MTDDTKPATLPSPASGEGEADRLREALKVGENFLNKCNAAWAAGEPSHRVQDMLDAADKFRAALDSQQEKG